MALVLLYFVSFTFSFHSCYFLLFRSIFWYKKHILAMGLYNLPNLNWCTCVWVFFLVWTGLFIFPNLPFMSGLLICSKLSFGIKISLLVIGIHTFLGLIAVAIQCLRWQNCMRIISCEKKRISEDHVSSCLLTFEHVGELKYFLKCVSVETDLMNFITFILIKNKFWLKSNLNVLTKLVLVFSRISMSTSLPARNEFFDAFPYPSLCGQSVISLLCHCFEWIGKWNESCRTGYFCSFGSRQAFMKLISLYPFTKWGSSTGPNTLGSQECGLSHVYSSRSPVMAKVPKTWQAKKPINIVKHCHWSYSTPWHDRQRRTYFHSLSCPGMVRMWLTFCLVFTGVCFNCARSSLPPPSKASLGIYLTSKGADYGKNDQQHHYET